ncbi:MFS transporter [Solirubrobacter taibaiensis]|nr:MFS transporter [Solirubrobacter taibaiensis]
MLRLSTEPELPGPAWRTRAWAIVGALSITETVSWGILYYAFAAFLVPMQRDLDASAAQLTGAFSLALAVSAIAGVFVGRHLDRRSPRTLMTIGSIAGTGLVVAWSQVHGLMAFYALWFAIGLVMAAVLYEPAFTVLAKQFHDARERRRAMTAMTLVAALASFIFLPLSQALIDAYGWRDALVVLAVILAATTVPLHGLVLRPAAAPTREPAPSAPAGAVLRSSPFWLLSGAFVLAALATIAMTVFAIPFLLERGHSPAFAAFAVGLIGVSQIPGRILFARLHAEPWNVFALIGLGVAVVVAFDSTAAVLIGLVLLGMGNGMATLSRATAIADLYGAAAYGTIASVAGGVNTAARAAGPFLAAVYATVVGYTGLLWTLVALAAVAAVLARLVRNDDVAGLRGA